MDSLRGGPATAQIRAGLHRFRCGYRCFPLDCWPNLRENAFQDETNCAKIEVTTFPSTIRQEHCCCWIRRHRTTAARAIRKTRSAPARHPLTARLLLSGLTLLARLLLRPRSSFRQRPGYSSTRVLDRIPRCAASFILLKSSVTVPRRKV